jgi:hypothetical protein
MGIPLFIWAMNLLTADSLISKQLRNLNTEYLNRSVTAGSLDEYLQAKLTAARKGPFG